MFPKIYFLQNPETHIFIPHPVIPHALHAIAQNPAAPCFISQQPLAGHSTLFRIIPKYGLNALFIKLLVLRGTLGTE